MRYQPVQQCVLQVVYPSPAHFNACFNLRADNAGNISSSYQTPHYQTPNYQVLHYQTPSDPLPCRLRRPRGSSLTSLELTYV